MFTIAIDFINVLSPETALKYRSGMIVHPSDRTI